jgi:osmoprotectant transport system ATP-binding protein
MFRLDSVTKSYSGKLALDDITLAIRPGQTTVLIGPSGCGKSTIFGLMTGLFKPDSGTVSFEDTVLNAENINSIRLRLGYVIQDGGLFPHLTGHENICLMAEYLKWPAVKIHERVADLITLTRLSPEILKRYPTEISGGQRQRVSLMRALMLDPDVLLLDEPLGALDPMVRAEVQDDLAAIFRRLQKTVVLVTHDLNEASLFADRLILLNDGMIIQDGSTSDLFDRPTEPFVAQFIGAQQKRALMGAIR